MPRPAGVTILAILAIAGGASVTLLGLLVIAGAAFIASLDFTGMPLSDEGRAKALLYTSSLPSTIERQCLAQSPWVGQYRPLGLRIWNEVDDGRVVATGAEGDVANSELFVLKLEGGAWKMHRYIFTSSAPPGQR